MLMAEIIMSTNISIPNQNEPQFRGPPPAPPSMPAIGFMFLHHVLYRAGRVATPAFGGLQRSPRSPIPYSHFSATDLLIVQSSLTVRITPTLLNGQL